MLRPPVVKGQIFPRWVSGFNIKMQGAHGLQYLRLLITPYWATVKVSVAQYGVGLKLLLFITIVCLTHSNTIPIFHLPEVPAPLMFRCRHAHIYKV